jgi:type VII secretion protein EccB
MPSTPTTKSQVQAYRFVLRRMESALVRKDPVMLHDPMRSHKRATVVGAIIGVVGLVGFLLFGVLKPAPTVPSSGIVIAQPSGSIYVVNQSPRELIPVFNLASARLLLAASTNQAQQNSGSSSSAAPTVVNPTTVDDDQLTNIPLGRLTGIPAGPTVLPKPGQSPTTWAVCDAIPRDPDALNQTGHTPPSTTVMVGVPNIGSSLPAGQAVLVSDDSGRSLYLVYGLQSSVDPDDSAVRAQVDTTDPAVISALHIDTSKYRVVSSAVLNAIPRVAELVNPVGDGMNIAATPAPGLQSAGLKMGESFSVGQVGQTPQYFMVVPGGMQQVSETTAQIARFENSSGLAQIKEVQPDTVNQVTQVQPGTAGSLKVNVSDYPGAVPQLISADNEPVMCLGWTADYTDAQKPIARTRVTIGTTMDIPSDPNGGQMAQVPIGQGTTMGRINDFFMNPSLGGTAVRAATGADEFGDGPIYVIDPRGVAYSVPDTTTAQVLGVADGSASGDLPPAPESIVGLLPSGGSPLDEQSVLHTYDGMSPPSGVGSFLPLPTQSNGGG